MSKWLKNDGWGHRLRRNNVRSLSKREKDNGNPFIREEDKRKIYQITELGIEVLQIELKRIERLYKIAQEEL